MASKINHFLLHLLRFKPFLGVDALNGAREKHRTRPCTSDFRISNMADLMGKCSVLSYLCFMTDGTVLLATFIFCPAQVR